MNYCCYSEGGKKTVDLWKGYKKVLVFIFIVYLAALFRITVFRSGFDFSNAFLGGEVNLVPFADLLKVFASDKKAFIYLFFGNIVWFVPFGFLLRRITAIKAGWIILLGFFLSLFIETMQLVFGVGVFETDDLLLNTLGAALGAKVMRK